MINPYSKIGKRLKYGLRLQRKIFHPVDIIKLNQSLEKLSKDDAKIIKCPCVDCIVQVTCSKKEISCVERGKFINYMILNMSTLPSHVLNVYRYTTPLEMRQYISDIYERW